MPRTRFNSSGLVRILAELTATEVASRQTFAERLGQWLDFNDALALYSALNADAAGGGEVPAAPPALDAEAAGQALARVRAMLAGAIAADEALASDAGAAAAVAASADGEADFAPYHRRYLAHQRDMASRIAPLRATLRTALARRSPALRRLAVLDAALEQGMAARERDLLATVPVLLGRRFEQLKEAHGLRPDDGEGAGDPHPAMQAGDWLAAFRRELRTVLLAELELRLQPAAGLFAALRNEESGKQ